MYISICINILCAHASNVQFFDDDEMKKNCFSFIFWNKTNCRKINIQCFISRHTLCIPSFCFLFFSVCLKRSVYFIPTKLWFSVIFFSQVCVSIRSRCLNFYHMYTLHIACRYWESEQKRKCECIM